jgi:hypothetical protein
MHVHALTSSLLLFQGEPSSFAWFTAHGCVLHLDDPTDIVWAHMVQAQILVIAPSAFSLVPAYYNKGIVVYAKQKFQSARRLGHWVTAAELIVLLPRVAVCRHSAAA